VFPAKRFGTNHCIALSQNRSDSRRPLLNDEYLKPDAPDPPLRGTEDCGIIAARWRQWQKKAPALLGMRALDNGDLELFDFAADLFFALAKPLL
jgi:hypothetical protein